MKITSLLFALLLLFEKVEAQENCHLRKDEEGIKVFLCKTEGSSFKTIKVNFEVKTTLKEYAAGLLAINSYTQWQYNIINPKIIERISNQELIYYSEVDTPWPIAHRDLVFHLKMWQDTSSLALKMTLKQLPNYIPHKEGIVRIPEAESLLTVTPIDADRVSVNYVIHVDPGGEVPAFLTNMFAAQTPWHTFNNYRERLESGIYDKKEIPFIKNYQKKEVLNDTKKEPIENR